jgi:hypothetical protein
VAGYYSAMQRHTEYVSTIRISGYGFSTTASGPGSSNSAPTKALAKRLVPIGIDILPDLRQALGGCAQA